MSTDGDEFFETHSTMDSFMVSSPQPAPNPSRRRSRTGQQQPPTPSTSDRPPLASVNVSKPTLNDENSPVNSSRRPSGFKFDKDHDKFNVGTSPPKSQKSPGKKLRSPSKRSSPLVSPRPQSTHQSDVSTLEGSPLSEAEPSPSPFKPRNKPQVTTKFLPSMRPIVYEL